MILNERLTTQLGGKMAPARMVAAKKAPLVVALRLFGITKLRLALPDWRFFNHNADNQIIVNRP